MMTNKLKPDWAGEDLVSRFVNLLIGTKPIYKVMKHQARQVLIKTAEKKGIPWRQTYQELEGSGAKGLLEEMTNPNVVYPDYYKMPFHAYEEGNLCWQAAFEASSATQAMGLRVWPKENITWETAQSRLRGGFHQVLDQYSPETVKDVLIFDERLARRIADLYNLTYTGTLGVLVKTKQAGYIASVALAISMLRAKGMWLTDKIIDDVLQLSGE